MSDKSMFSLVKSSLANFFRSPILIALGVVLFFFFFVYSKFGGTAAHYFQTTFSNLFWVLFSTAVFILVSGVFTTLFIFYSQKDCKILKIKAQSAIKKFWLKNSLVVFLYLIFFNLVNLTLLLFTRLLIYLSPHFRISVEMFRLSSTIIAFVWVAAIIIFLSFVSFFIVLENLPFFSAIRSSINFVKWNYIPTLSLTVIFYVVIFFINKINNAYADFLNYALVLPFMFLLLTRFVIEFRK